MDIKMLQAYLDELEFMANYAETEVERITASKLLQKEATAENIKIIKNFVESSYEYLSSPEDTDEDI